MAPFPVEQHGLHIARLIEDATTAGGNKRTRED